MLIYGKNVAKETLRNNTKVKKVYLLNDFRDEEILNELNSRNINIEYIDKKRMDKMDLSNNQGIVLEVPDYNYCDISDLLVPNPFIVILDHLEDPHNFGAIIRSCEAAGVTGIIIPKDRSVSVNSTVMKTSTGALNNVKICMVTNLNRAIEELKKNGIWILGTDMDGTDYRQMDYNMPIALVIGSEGFGMSKLVKEKCDYIVSIPMKGKVNSLNASVAAGIMIFKVNEGR